MPAITNGMGRGIVPGGHPLLVTKARGAALGGADLVVVVGTPLDFRLGYGVFGGKDGATPARVVHVADSPGQVSRARRRWRPRSSGDLTTVLDGLLEPRCERDRRKPDWSAWVDELADVVRAAVARDASCSRAEADPIHPARIYGELVPRLADDSVVIGDGGDFVSFAGKFVEPQRPGGWLDPGPYGCLGAGLGAAIAARLARPSAQVMLLLGDGAAGFSLMDVDTLVRHDLPVVMVMGNNSAWGLEKGPMQMLYGYDVVADLAQRTALRRGGRGARRRRRDGHRPEADRPRARPGLRRRACPTSSTSSPTSRRPTRAAPSASESAPDASCGAPGPTSCPPSGELTVAAYADFTLGPDDPYSRAPARRRDPRRARRELWVASRTTELLGCVTCCPPGSPWRELAGERRGRVPDAGRRARRPRARGRRGAGRAGARSGPRARRHRAMVLSSLPRDGARAPHLHAAGLPARARARLGPGARRRTSSPSTKELP